MGLMQHTTVRVDIPLPGNNSFSVRGLDADDMTLLISKHLEPVSRAADLYAKHHQSAFTNANLVNFFGVLSTEFPGLVMEVISIAADEPEARDVKIGLAAQLAALSAIFQLTIEDAGGLGNLFGHLSALVKGALQSANDRRPQQNHLRDSIGASGRMSTS